MKFLCVYVSTMYSAIAFSLKKCCPQIVFLWKSLKCSLCLVRKLIFDNKYQCCSHVQWNCSRDKKSKLDYHTSEFDFNNMQIIHGLVDRVMEKNGVPFVSPGDKTGYYIERSDVSENCIDVFSYVCVLTSKISPLSFLLRLTAWLTVLWRSLSFLRVGKRKSFLKDGTLALLALFTQRYGVTITKIVFWLDRGLIWQCWGTLRAAIMLMIWKSLFC